MTPRDIYTTSITFREGRPFLRGSGSLGEIVDGDVLRFERQTQARDLKILESIQMRSLGLARQQGRQIYPMPNDVRRTPTGKRQTASRR
jgi:hypothetical protein